MEDQKKTQATMAKEFVCKSCGSRSMNEPKTCCGALQESACPMCHTAHKEGQKECGSCSTC